MAKADSASRTSKLARWRFWVQATFLLVWLDPLVLRLHTICCPVFHCYSCPWATFACPIGILACFSAVHTIPFVAIGTLLVFGALFGSFVCGWACPFGFLQDLIARVPTPKFTLPAWAGHCRYVVLIVLVLAVPFWYGEKSALFFCSLCPASALEVAAPHAIGQAIAGQAIAWPSLAKSTIFVLILVVMFFNWRPWCTLFCPLGAIYGLLNRVSFLFLRFHPQQCRDCAVCRSLCPDGQRSEARLDGLQCVRCLECTKCRAITLDTVFGNRPEDSLAPGNGSNGSQDVGLQNSPE